MRCVLLLTQGSFPDLPPFPAMLPPPCLLRSNWQSVPFLHQELMRKSMEMLQLEQQRSAEKKQRSAEKEQLLEELRQVVQQRSAEKEELLKELLQLTREKHECEIRALVSEQRAKERSAEKEELLKELLQLAQKKHECEIKALATEQRAKERAAELLRAKGSLSFRGAMGGCGSAGQPHAFVGLDRALRLAML